MWTSETDSSPQPKKVLDGGTLMFSSLMFPAHIAEAININVVTTHGLTFVSDWSTPKGMADRNHCNLLCLFSFPSSVLSISAINNDNDEIIWNPCFYLFPALWMHLVSLQAGEPTTQTSPSANRQSEERCLKRSFSNPVRRSYVVRFTFSVDLCSVCWLQNWVGGEISNV